MTDMGQVLIAVDQYADAVAADKTLTLETALATQQDLTRAALDKLKLSEAEVKRLRAELAALQPAGMLVGACVNVPKRDLASFQAADKLIGPLTVRRSFPTSSTIAKQTAADTAAGYVSFVSIKPPAGIAATATGKSDGLLESIARTLPAGTYFTCNHEPENDMNGPTFVGMHRHVYQVMKNANPDLLMGPVHLTYAWRNSAGVGNAGNNTGPLEAPSAWDVGDDHRDFTGADVYSAKGIPLAEYPNWLNWWEYFNTASRKPKLVVEYGTLVTPPGQPRDPAREAKRAALIPQDAAYLSDLGVGMLLAWYGTGTQGDWSYQDDGSQAAFKSVAAQGRTP